MALIFIGILPLLLGISMWLQQKLNPAPTDPTQQMIFAWMPWVFMFMLGGFASGLVVYWIANNTITFTQQYLIMRSQGYKPDVFGNIKGGFKPQGQTDARNDQSRSAVASSDQKPRARRADIGDLTAGQTMPWDRVWAVAHDASKADGSDGRLRQFQPWLKGTSLMAIEARWMKPRNRDADAS